MIFLRFLFKKYFGSTVDPMKKETNAIASVMARLVEGEFKDKIRKSANTSSTISG